LAADAATAAAAPDAPFNFDEALTYEKTSTGHSSSSSSRDSGSASQK
jgi:hypothetical protein